MIHNRMTSTLLCSVVGFFLNLRDSKVRYGSKRQLTLSICLYLFDSLCYQKTLQRYKYFFIYTNLSGLFFKMIPFCDGFLSEL